MCEHFQIQQRASGSTFDLVKTTQSLSPVVTVSLSFLFLLSLIAGILLHSRLFTCSLIGEFRADGTARGGSRVEGQGTLQEKSTGKKQHGGGKITHTKSSDSSAFALVLRYRLLQQQPMQRLLGKSVIRFGSLMPLLVQKDTRYASLPTEIVACTVSATTFCTSLQ